MRARRWSNWVIRMSFCRSWWRIACVCRAGRTFGPHDVLSAILRTAVTGIRGVVTAIVIERRVSGRDGDDRLGILKLTTNQDVGVFRLSTGQLFIGADNNVDGVDLTGGWFAPLAIVTGVSLFLLLTWAYGRVNRPRVGHALQPIQRFLENTGD